MAFRKSSEPDYLKWGDDYLTWGSAKITKRSRLETVEQRMRIARLAAETIRALAQAATEFFRLGIQRIAAYRRISQARAGDIGTHMPN